MLQVWIWDGVGIHIVVLRRDMMAWIVSRHVFKMEWMVVDVGVTLIFGVDGNVAEI